MKLEYKSNKSQTINDILKNNFKFSTNFIKFLKRNKCIYLNNKQAYVSQIANKNDLVSINLDYEEDNTNIVPTKMNLNIVFEDDYLLIIDKPANLAIHPSINHYNNSLSNGIKYYYLQNNVSAKIRPVNRLDKDTSGLVIFAKYPFIQDALSKQMQNGNFKKYYLAIITGKFNPPEGTIDLPIVRKDNSIIERIVDTNNKDKKAQAITEYKTIKSNDDYSLVEFHLITGRTHQIRVHSSYLGHPLLGDTLYGTKSDLIDHQALHSYKIEFIHPITNKKISLQSKPNFLNIIKDED